MNALFLSVLSNLCVAALIAGIAWFVGRSGRRAATAHLLWVAAFIKLITPPILVAPIEVPPSLIGFVQSAADEGAPVETASAAELTNPLAVSRTSMPAADEGSPRESIALTSSHDGLFQFGPLQTLALIWAVGTAVLLIRGTVRFVGFLRLIRHEGVLDRRAMVTARRMLKDGSNRGRRPLLRIPPVYRISIRVSPMLFGLGRWTAVICPEQLWKSLPLDGRRAFLAHELAHYRRGDHWVRWLEWFVTSIYWWLPAIYPARRQLELHEEVACDAWALDRLRTPPRKYAETLLSVVDFLSETPAASPRLASRMHAADSLEKRLRWIMSPRPPAPPTRTASFLLVAVVALLLLIHPRPQTADGSTRDSFADAALSVGPVLDEPSIEPSPLAAKAAGERQGEAIDESLPPSPQGWWTDRPESTWAAHLLSDDLLIRGSAGRGIAIGRGERLFRFEPQELRAAAFIPATGRLFLGNRRSEIHLWDPDVLRSVSLIGRHPSPVTSLGFHPQGGLVSGDEDGNLISWNPSSGEISAAVSLGDTIVSVRWSSDGERLAAVTGGWDEGDTQQVHFLRDRGLEPELSFALPPATAVVQVWPRPALPSAPPQPDWVTIDWAGEVRSLVNGSLVAVIPKSEVSAAVLCQDFLIDGLRNITRSVSEESSIPTRSVSEESPIPTRSVSEESSIPTRSVSEESSIPTRSVSEESSIPTRSVSEELQ